MAIQFDSYKTLCMSRHWPPPPYDFTAVKGFSHDRSFSISCSIGNHKEIGVRKNKKISKRQAVCKVMQKIDDACKN